jgi:hypothetical protein
VKTVRQVPVSDRLWASLGALAESLGTDREALLQQALHAFLRFHGALPAEPPGEATAVAGPANGAAAAFSRTPAGQSNGAGAALAAGASLAIGTLGRTASTRRVLETARELERAISPAGRARTSPTLTLQPGQGSPIAVDRDRFLIGRGRHCDLVIDSAKVSREHAVIRREGEAWWIEDLGSSNGTWFDRARIDRRRIRDGDEFLVCAERVRCRIA